MQDTTAPERTLRLPSVTRSRTQQSQLWTVVGLFVLLLSLALFPPLLSLGRYQRRIAQSISRSLGRPVHLDRVTLNLLPLPSLSIENFVLDEDPAFGDEPILRANSVVANLRVTSLWRRRIEISSMRFAEPSVNLLLRPDGRWNIESVLLQAAHIDVAPTAQRLAGAAPRFPYIEASGARLNLKLGANKTPFSLTEADFALFLAEPQLWRMRLKAKPVRTDTSVSDTGVIEAEVSLRRAKTLDLVPIALEATWRNAPLGDTTRILFGRDIGLRGAMRFSVKSAGTLGRNDLTTRLEVEDLHRSDFVTANLLQVKVDCAADAQKLFHSLANLRCAWPVPDSQGSTIALTGAVPDVLHLESADLQLGTGRLPMPTVLGWMRVFSGRIAPELTVRGNLSASIAHDAGTPPGAWSGEAIVDDLVLADGKTEHLLELGSVSLAASPSPPPVQASASRHLLRSVALAQPAVSRLRATPDARSLGLDSAAGSHLRLDPVPLSLGAAAPAFLDGDIDAHGYTLRLSGYALPERLEQWAAILPMLGNGLPVSLGQRSATTPVRLDLTTTRVWGGPQVWTTTLPHPQALLVQRPARERSPQRP